MDVIKKYFFQFLKGDLSVEDFEQWVYDNSDCISKELGSDLSMDLISFNYNQRDLSELRDKLRANINGKEYDIWRTKKLLTAIIEQKIDVVIAARKLRILYFETGENLIPEKLGIGYDSVLDDIPIPSEYAKWNEKALNEQLKVVNYYKDDMIKNAKKFLLLIMTCNPDL